MTREELYEKFLKLSVKLDNLYNDSELDITDKQYNQLSNWIKNIAYVLGFEPSKFTDKQLQTYMLTYRQAETEVYSRYHK